LRPDATDLVAPPIGLAGPAATSRPSPPLISGVFAFRRNQTMYPKVQIHVQFIPTTNCANSSIGSENELNIYLNPRECREVAVPKPPKIVRSELLH
jgi:hypothetical protein